MNRNIPLSTLFFALLLSLGCGKSENDRILELHAKPALYSSQVLAADPAHPEDDIIVPMSDSLDITLYEAYTDKEPTHDYIPESVLALSCRRADYKGERFSATIAVGDTVDVLESVIHKNQREVYLVRTTHNTYAWLFNFHLQDKNGRRLSTFH